MGNRSAMTKRAEDGTVAQWYKYVYNDSNQLVKEELYDGKGNSKSEGTDDAGYGNATNAEANNSQNQSGILFPIDSEVSTTEQSLIDKIKTTGNQKNYELMEYINDVNRAYAEVLVEQNINGKTDTSYIYGVDRLSLDRFDGNTGYYLYNGESYNPNTKSQYLRTWLRKENSMR